MQKKILSALLCGTVLLSSFGLTTVSAQADDTKKINIAYQYGLAYAPLILAQQEGMIEAAYEELTGGTLEVTWTQMSSGPDINTGMTSGDLQAGFMGVAPAITGITAKIGYKIFTGLSGQEHGMITNDESITSLEDLIGSDKQIALVNIGSIQHIILAKALDDAGLDAHALDSNLVAMKHPDGMTSLQTGSVACHVTSNPYIFKEREDDSLYEIPGVSEAWTVDDSFIVGIASEKLHDEEPEVYEALCTGIAEAIDTVNADIEAAAAITCEYDGNTAEEELEYMEAGRYSTETHNILTLAQFMAEQSFIDEAPESYEDLVFDNVQGD